MNAPRIGVGLVGYGMAGRVFHAPVIQSVPGLELRKIVTRRANDCAVRYPSVEVVGDIASLLHDRTIALVVVATPTATHFDLARQALVAVKHVVVEKPFTVGTAQAKKLIELARRVDRVLTVYQNRRWDGDFRTVRAVIDAGLLGRLVEYESRFDRYRNRPREGAWREQAGEGSGILFDLGSHLIDQALVLFGAPAAIAADIRLVRDFAKADDRFELVLHYERLRVALGASMLARRPGPRFTLHGTEGSFVKHGVDPQEEALKQGGAPTAEGWGEDLPERWGTLVTRVGGLQVHGRVETLAGGYQAFYQNVAEAVAGRAEPAVSPEDALRTIRAIELATESSQEGRTLPFTI